MNKYASLFAVVAAIAILGGGFYLVSNNSFNPSIVSTTKERQISTDSNSILAADGEESDSFYGEYENGVLETTSGKKQILFFYANWCPTCRPVDAEFKARRESIPSGLAIIRVNYNDPDTDSEEKKLAEKYGITYQHTFVQINANGDEVAKWNGGGLTELKRNIK